VNDFAWKKGDRYGTILVDLEAHHLVDVLPDREAETVFTWLKTHPVVQVISRDQAGNYADGARRGPPQAMQVVDRLHLLLNLTTALLNLREYTGWSQHETSKPVFLEGSPARGVVQNTDVANVLPLANGVLLGGSVALAQYLIYENEKIDV
jgi:transposase